MKNDILELKRKFEKIKSIGLVKSLRAGSTGVGYTFESLLNKAEDQKSTPDFKSIELKCKLGYSKSSLTLFNCAPKRHGNPANNYIFANYAQHRYNNKNDLKIFERKVFHNYTIERNGITFKVFVDYYAQELVMKSYQNNEFIENVCSWDFKSLERKLKIKLNTLAIIEAYPYKRNKEIYYKYVKLSIYKLRGFFEFLQLIEKDKIQICFYMKQAIGNKNEVKQDNNQNNNVAKNIDFKDHGVAFRIRLDYIDELFYRVKI